MKLKKILVTVGLLTTTTNIKNTSNTKYIHRLNVKMTCHTILFM